ncbi:MAG: VOC family protein [Planctomycetaceae bacterium]
MLTSAIDHLVVTAPTLASGIQHVEQSLRCKMQPGGQHPRMGTYNALLKIGDQCYLEVISADPGATSPSRPRWFELDSLLPDTRPRLATWVLRTNDIDTVSKATKIDLGIVEEMSRGSLEWQITIPPDGRLPFHGVAPTVIQWKAELHPANKLPESSASLIQLVGHHPNARHITAMLNAASFKGPFSVAEPPDGVSIGLTATFRTQQGMVVLS